MFLIQYHFCQMPGGKRLSKIKYVQEVTPNELKEAINLKYKCSCLLNAYDLSVNYKQEKGHHKRITATKSNQFTT